MVHKAPDTKSIKHLRSEVPRLDSATAVATELEQKDDLGEVQYESQNKREEALAETDTPAISCRARARVSVFKIKKATRKATPKGNEREYWYTAWSVVGKSRNVYLGSCEKMSREEAMDKARAIKRAEVGIAAEGIE